MDNKEDIPISKEDKLDALLAAFEGIQSDLSSVTDRLASLEQGQAGATGFVGACPKTVSKKVNVPDPEEEKGFQYQDPTYTDSSSDEPHKADEVKKIYQAYQSLKESVNKIILDDDLVITDQRFTIKDSSKRAVGITRKSGRYLNTTWKILVDLCNSGDITDAGADKLYVCMKAHTLSLTQDLKYFLFEGTNVPKEVLSNLTVLENNPLVDQKTVESFKTSCEIYTSAEKARHAAAASSNINTSNFRGNRNSGGYSSGGGGYRQFVPRGRGQSNPSFRGGGYRGQPRGYGGGYGNGYGYYSDRYSDYRDNRDMFDQAVSQNTSKP